MNAGKYGSNNHSKQLKGVLRRAISLVAALAIGAPFAMSAPVAMAQPADAEDVSASNGGDNGDLFAQYVQHKIDSSLPGGQISLYGNYGEDSLKGLERSLYDALKAKVESVADGEISSTQFTFDNSTPSFKTTFTAQELGVPAIKNADGSLTSEADAVISDIVYPQRGNKSFVNKVIRTLLVDCPYDLYWYDKTPGQGWRGEIPNATYTATSSTVTFNVSYSIKMTVAGAYRGGDQYTTNAGKTSATSKVIAKAQQIVAAHSGESDYQKLVSYRDEIDGLVDYNFDAMGKQPYGDPWQLIYVFDEDPSTKVVCEGYAKAFQYLVDLSTFNGNVVSHIITGTMGSSTSSMGAHMWNNVSINGKNYLVDLTEFDGGWDTFLIGGVKNEGNAFSHTEADGHNTIYYAYDTDARDLYQGSNVLTLADKNYSPSDDMGQPDDKNVIITQQPKSLTLQKNYTGASLSVTAVVPKGSAASYQWYEVNGGDQTPITGATSATYTIPEGKENGWTGRYLVKVTAGGKTVVSDVATVTVGAANTGEPTILTPPLTTEVTYHGQLDLAGIKVDFGDGKGPVGPEGIALPNYDYFKPGVQTVTLSSRVDPSKKVQITMLMMFRDVDERTPHYNEIHTLLEKDITRGFSDGSFRGMNSLNRQDLAAFLYRVAGSPEYTPSASDFVFNDVTTATPHYREILWAAKNGVVSGYTAADGTRTYKGGKDILRQDLVAMLYRLAGSPAVDDASFTDVNESTPHRDAIAWAKQAGVTTGFGDGSFKGGRTIVRQDTAAFLGRVIDKNLIKAF